MNQTPNTLSDLRYTDPEEALIKYGRVIAGCFDILGVMLEEFGKDERIEKYSILFSNQKFWTCASNKQASIRAAFYRFIKNCCSKSFGNKLIN